MNKFSEEALRLRSTAIAEEIGGLEGYMGLLVRKRRCYPDLVSCLIEAAKTSPDKVREHIRQFYGCRPGKIKNYFPHGDKLETCMGELVVDMANKWFNPTRQYTTEELQPEVDQIVDAFKLNNNYNAPLANDICVGDGASWGTTLNDVESAARSTTWDAARKAAWNAAYILGQNKLKEIYPQNPFTKLMNVYEKGLLPAGISQDKESFVIWHPPVRKVA